MSFVLDEQPNRDTEARLDGAVRELAADQLDAALGEQVGQLTPRGALGFGDGDELGEAVWLPFAAHRVTEPGETRSTTSDASPLAAQESHTATRRPVARSTERGTALDHA